VIEASAAPEANPAPVVLVGGVGLPWLRDLDFGTQFIRRVETETWPDGVVIEDLSYAAHRVLHRLQELMPAKVVLVGAMPRGIDPPGTVRRYLLDLTPPAAEEVHERLTEAAGGIIDLDHTLAVGRHWHGFPANTVVIEVEPADRSFGLGFSEPVEAVVDSVLAMIRQEVQGVDDEGGQAPGGATYSPPPSSEYTPSGFAGFACLPAPSDHEAGP
jgi:hydrogenase maturation protease